MNDLNENSNNINDLKEIVEIQNSTINKLKSQIDIIKYR